MRRLAVLALAVFGLAACPDRTISKVPPQQQGVQIKKIPVSADIDILFVIDNSSSTADKQAVFQANFPAFINVLQTFPTGLPNVHIGVTSTSVSIGSSNAQYGASCLQGDDGVLQNTPRGTCTAPSNRYIIDVSNGAGGRTTNYSGTLSSAFTCIAALGTTGCGFEAQLEAMKRALDGSHPENQGFIREGAYLAVIILTDEDDCSVADPSIFGLDLGSSGLNLSDYRCQPLYAYKCDQVISQNSPGMYTNCAPTGVTPPYLQDPVSSYYNFLTTKPLGGVGIKPASQIVVALVAGGTGANPPSGAMLSTGSLTFPASGQTQQLALLPSCTATINGNMNFARPAIRLDEFRQQFGSHGIFQTVCQADYSMALTTIGNLLFTAISPCLEGPVATCGNGIDPTSAACTSATNPGGIAVNCTVADVVNEGTSMETQTQIPPCMMTNATTPAPGQSLCYYITKNTTVCNNSNGLTPTSLQINFVRTSPPAVGTVTDVNCAVQSSM